MYSRLVRSGGTIAFHDIVPDHGSRGWTRTAAWSGGVPLFWREIKGQYETSEYVEHPDQDGYGIGLLSWPGAPP
jgi:hypothetical protein